nr:hypothetical protein DMOBY_01660 [Dehalococcoides mccartyi]
MIISKPSNPGSKENTPKTTDSKPEKDMDCLLRGYLGGVEPLSGGADRSGYMRGSRADLSGLYPPPPDIHCG